MDQTAPLLHIDNLHFSHPQQALWQGWSADLYPGVTLLRGGDGSGKTTLLRLLAGDLAPQKGALVLQGVDGTVDRDGYR